MRLAGKRVLITGTGTPGGQGVTAQRLFCEQGAAVAGCDVKPGAAEAAAGRLRDSGQRACGLTADLGDPEAARWAVEWAVSELGGLDVLYNNAGAAAFAFFEDMTADEWRFTLRNELDAVFHVTAAAWHLKARRGSIISTASVAGVFADGHLGLAAHAAAKAGLIGLTRQLAAEGAPDGIRVNVICPGFVDSPAVAAMPGRLREYMTSARTMLGRAARPDEIAGMAMYLASDESGFVTGATLTIDGGWTSGSAAGFAAAFGAAYPHQ